MLLACSPGKFPGQCTYGQARHLCDAASEHAIRHLEVLEDVPKSFGANVEVHLVQMSGNFTGSGPEASNLHPEGSDLPLGACQFSFASMVYQASEKAYELIDGESPRVAVACRILAADIFQNARDLCSAVSELGFLKGRQDNAPLTGIHRHLPVTIAASLGVCPHNALISFARVKLVHNDKSGNIYCDAFPSQSCWKGFGDEAPEVSHPKG